MGEVGATPAGWYPDPAGSGQQRYYDGQQWTAQYAPAAGPPIVVAPRKSNNGKVVLIVFLALFLLCGGGCVSMIASMGSDNASSDRSSSERSSTSWSKSAVAAPPLTPTSTAEPVPAKCNEAPAVIVEMINASFTNGQHLEDAQALDGPDASTYVAGNIVRADGERDSSHEAWVFSGGVVYALTSNARRDTLFPDGRDLFPLFFGQDYAKLDNCITNVTRARNGAPPIPMR